LQDKELYQHILGLASPWKVESVKLDIEAGEISVHVDHPRGVKFACPNCSKELSCFDHGEERRWRHLDSCQFKTILVAKVPRVQCPEHGVKSVAVPWAEANSRFTILFERFAIDLLQETQNVKGAMNILRIKWDATWNILQRAVARGKGRKEALPIPHIGIDEKAFKKGQSYLSMIYDLEKSTVEAISEGNDTAAGIACFSKLSKGQIESVKAIAMDMSAAYVKAAKQVIPLAEEKIVHDRFHVMQLASKAVDKVRKQEHKQLSENGDKRLAGTKYVWLRSFENQSEQQEARFNEIYDHTLNTAKAWCQKETLRELWNQPDIATATHFFKDWYRSVIHTKLEPMKALARTLKERLQNVVSYCKLGITNAVAEGMNSKIMAIKRRVGGFRNIENFKTAIFFYCGGLDLYPR